MTILLSVIIWKRTTPNFSCLAVENYNIKMVGIFNSHFCRFITIKSDDN